MARVCPSWLSFMLYNPVRKAFTDRHRILDESGITPDCIVLEVGAGNGFLTEVIVKRAQKVICVELQDGMVRKLKKRVKRFGNKIEIITTDIASQSIGDACADVCLLYFTFHEVEDKAQVNKNDMRKSIALFEQSGFVKEREFSRTFTRFARLRKL
jgi:ubiquinone/menaquinone biosynthesis C-methylase UbiE